MSAASKSQSGRPLPKSVELLDDLILTLDKMERYPLTGGTHGRRHTAATSTRDSKKPSAESSKKAVPMETESKTDSTEGVAALEAEMASLKAKSKTAPLSKKEKKRMKQLKKEKKTLLQAAAASKKGGAKKKKKRKPRKAVHILPSYFLHPAGAALKESLSQPMAATYDTCAVESQWDAIWQQKGYYKPEVGVGDASAKEQFVMMLPPPNVTGSLHLGHALMATVEDTIVRFWRMRGKNCLWLPGTDHAGIATQSVVERMLAKDGISRVALGREEFLARVWAWKREKGGRIIAQMKRMGLSLDWSREVFTLDAKLSTAVTEAFVRMHEKKLVYRANRLCHWSCALQSAISNAEVDLVQIKKPTLLRVPNYKQKIKFGILHKFAYKLVPLATQGPDSGCESLIVATTRLETMLGDTAVAIHPDDGRYKHLHGRRVQHPFLDRTLPIVCDKHLVDMAFGTGAVKITPAHDENDFDCGKRHGLEFVNVLTADGRMNANCGPMFEGLKRFDCRLQLVKRLSAIGQFHGEEANEMTLQLCSRSGDVIEPKLTPQWYVDCTTLAKRCVDAVDCGALRIRPSEGVRQWHHFLDSIRPWCVSRQLWWGHRIPAWLLVFEEDDADNRGQRDEALFAKEFAHDLQRWVVARSLADATRIAAERFPAKAKKGGIRLLQDADVLDTWFSSGLFPMSTLGWPNEESADFKQFFPGSLLETGGDILFFWVARMAMMSLCLTDKLPFTDVFLHSMVRDKGGAKMSKSKGNVIDPLHIIEGVDLQTLVDELHNGNISPKEAAKYEKMKRKEFPKGIPECGSDALRFGLLSYMSQTGDIKLDVQRVVGYRHFCNKIWNAVRFAMAKFPEGYGPPTNGEATLSADSSLASRWVLARLSAAIATCNDCNERYAFGDATHACHQFFVGELCDVFLEAIKPQFAEGGEGDDRRETCDVLFTCLEQCFRLLHPFMPFVSEELWQRLPGRVAGAESIMRAPYPSPRPKWKDAAAEKEMEAVLKAVAQIRSAKQQLFGLSTKSSYKVQLSAIGGADASAVLALLSARKKEVATLSISTEVTVRSEVVSDTQREELQASGYLPMGAAADGYTLWHKVRDDSLKVNWKKQIGKLRSKEAETSEQIADKTTELSDAKESLRRKIQHSVDSLKADRKDLRSLIALFEGFAK